MCDGILCWMTFFYYISYAFIIIFFIFYISLTPRGLHLISSYNDNKDVLILIQMECTWDWVRNKLQCCGSGLATWRFIVVLCRFNCKPQRLLQDQRLLFWKSMRKISVGGALCGFIRLAAAAGTRPGGSVKKKKSVISKWQLRAVHVNTPIGDGGGGSSSDGLRVSGELLRLEHASPLVLDGLMGCYELGSLCRILFLFIGQL